MKTFDNRIVIYDPDTYYQNDVIATFTEKDMLSWNCESTLTEAGYTGCRIQYTDPIKAEKLEYIYKIGNGTAPKIYEIIDVVENLAQAERVCKTKLRNLNTSEMKISFTTMGNAQLVACMNVRIEDFG